MCVLDVISSRVSTEWPHALEAFASTMEASTGHDTVLRVHLVRATKSVKLPLRNVFDQK